MEALTKLILLLALINSLFGLFICVRKSQTRASLLFGIVILCVGLWGFGIYMFYKAPPEHIRLWGNFVYFFGSFIYTNFLAFSLLFPNDNDRLTLGKTILIYLPSVFFIYLLFFSDVILLDFPINNNGRTITFGPLYFLYWLYFLVFVSSAVFILLRKYIAFSGIEKTHIGYILVGSAVSTILGTTSNLWLPTIGDFRFFIIGPYSSLFLVIFTSYAVFKHKLFNIRVIATELIVVLIWIFLSVQALIANSLRDRIIDASLLVLVVIFGIFLIRSVLQEVRLREEIQSLAEQLQKANSELKKLDQLKSEFVSLASHQLRTPLTVIKGYISLIQEGSFGKVSEPLEEALRKIYFSNERLISLVGDFLNLSRIESGKMKYMFEATDAEDLIASVYDEFKEVVKEKHLDLILEKSPTPLPKAMIDKDKFRQVIMNLVDNAIKYTPKGFIKLKVEADNSYAGAPSIVISISDSGIGMSEEDRNSIFKRFSRGEQGWKANTSGLGLGLYLAKRIVTDHGGEIWADSKGPGLGSIFFVRLPARA